MRADFPVSAYSLFPAQAAIARRKGPMEWSSSCPKCGGEDRFMLFAANGIHGDRYWCRQCGLKGFMDGKKKLTPTELAEYAEKRRLRLERERLERDKRVQALTTSAYWRGYHDAMRDAGRMAWRERGLPDEAQNWFDLGYTLFQGRNALSIPFHNREWAVETVQYRLLDTDGSGKYRFESGYPAVPFWTRPMTAGWPVIVCEGAIKAAVLFWRLVVEAERPYNVVAVTTKTPGRNESERLAEDIVGHEVLLLLDPDATSAERRRVGKHFEAVRHVSLPGKVDDMLLDGLGLDVFERSYLAQATETVL